MMGRIHFFDTRGRWQLARQSFQCGQALPHELDEPPGLREIDVDDTVLVLIDYLPTLMLACQTMKSQELTNNATA
jgi:hypothetical protein